MDSLEYRSMLTNTERSTKKYSSVWNDGCLIVSCCFELFLVFSSPKVQGKKSSLEKMGEVVDIMKKSNSDSGLQLAGMKVISKILEDEGPQERSTLRSDSAQSVR